MKKTYAGNRHGGAVRFEGDIDLSTGTFKCNCEICTGKMDSHLERSKKVAKMS